jgi:hypothetical protein
MDPVVTVLITVCFYILWIGKWIEIAEEIEEIDNDLKT